MDAHHDTSGIPAAQPVDPQAYREQGGDDGAARWYRDPDRWARAAAAGLLVLAWTLTDLGPAALAATVVVAAVSTVRGLGATARAGGPPSRWSCWPRSWSSSW